MFISTKSGKCQSPSVIHLTWMRDIDTQAHFSGINQSTRHTTSTGLFLLFCFCNGCAIPELVRSQVSVTHRSWSDIYSLLVWSYPIIINKFVLACWAYITHFLILRFIEFLYCWIITFIGYLSAFFLLTPPWAQKPQEHDN